MHAAENKQNQSKEQKRLIFCVALIKDGVRERDSFSRADEFPASGLSRFINSYFIRKKMSADMDVL